MTRLVNGGGLVGREYGAGRDRIDLLVRWPCTDAAGKRCWQREAVEMKVRRQGDADPLAKGLAQLDGYLDQHPGHQHPCHRFASGMGSRIASGPGSRISLDTGTLVVFDRRPEAAPVHERTRFEEATSPSGRAITVLRA